MAKHINNGQTQDGIVPFDQTYGGQGSSDAYHRNLGDVGVIEYGLLIMPSINSVAIDALERHGSEEQKSTYLEKLVSGEWTEPWSTESQSGTDLGAIRRVLFVMAIDIVLKDKIYITWGDHDMTDNIVHLV